MNSSILCIIFSFHSRIHCVHCSQCEQAEWQRHPGQAGLSIACPLNNTLHTEFTIPKGGPQYHNPRRWAPIPQSPKMGPKYHNLPTLSPALSCVPSRIRYLLVCCCFACCHLLAQKYWESKCHVPWISIMQATAWAILP